MIFDKFKSYFFGNKEDKKNTAKSVVLVGHPNVGKSVLFNILTGAYVTVSNYPGTTVEVARGRGNLFGYHVDFIDTPGMYSLLPITEEEKVSRQILLNQSADVVLHVVDAKNLKRMLPFTLQLLEANFPLILVVNIMDEARKLGIYIDIKSLNKELNIPVAGISAALGEGITSLKHTLLDYILDGTNKKVG